MYISWFFLSLRRLHYRLLFSSFMPFASHGPREQSPSRRDRFDHVLVTCARWWSCTQATRITRFATLPRGCCTNTCRVHTPFFVCSIPDYHPHCTQTCPSHRFWLSHLFLLHRIGNVVLLSTYPTHHTRTSRTHLRGPCFSRTNISPWSSCFDASGTILYHGRDGVPDVTSPNSPIPTTHLINYDMQIQ